MTGLELTLLLAFIGVVAIAVLAVIKWSHYGQWYHANDNWWEAQLSEIDKSIKLWHNFYVTALSAAQDLDLQVSDGNSHQIVQFNENQCLLFERNSARKVADEAKVELDKTETERLELEAELAFLKSNNHNIIKRCHSCGRGVAKSTPLVDGVYTCAKCAGKEVPYIEQPLRNLIAKAKSEGKNIRTPYQDSIFAPDTLNKLLNDGKFCWWYSGNWELTTTEPNYTLPEREPVVDIEPIDDLATPQDLTYALFEGLEGVRVGDSVLFSDGTIHNVGVLDEICNGLELYDGFFVVPPVGERHTAFWLGDGKHFCDQTDVRAIRIATALDIKLYGGEE